MSRMYEGWCPKVGDQVVYRSHGQDEGEVGKVVEIRGANAMVLYGDDRTAKSTPIYLLDAYDGVTT